MFRPMSVFQRLKESSILGQIEGGEWELGFKGTRFGKLESPLRSSDEC